MEPVGAMWRRRGDSRRPGRLLRRKRRRLVLRTTMAGCLVAGLTVGPSVGRALTDPGNAGFEARLAEWGRSHDLGGVVTWLENVQYNANPPRTGGTLSEEDLRQLQPSPAPQPPPAPLREPPRWKLNPITPLLADPVPHEGEWTPAVMLDGAPLVQVARLRSDPEHTSYLSAVAWIDQKRTRFTLFPGYQEPGGSGWSRPNHIPPEQRPGLVATYNGGFRLTNGDAKGGFHLDGKTAGPLQPGRATEVIRRDGSLAIGRWGREVSMTPDVAGVRQNLELLVDDGRVHPAVDTSDRDLWGVTVNNAYFVWRSGLGVTKTGDVVYAMGPALSVRTLAELLQRAGAVRAMELDINADWVSFMHYTDLANPEPVKLLDFKQKAARYFSTEERDFVAVYAR